MAIAQNLYRVTRVYTGEKGEKADIATVEVVALNEDAAKFASGLYIVPKTWNPNYISMGATMIRSSIPMPD